MGQPVVHFEIAGADAKKLQAFYASQFGWKINADNPMAYGVVDTGTKGKGINGGIFGQPPGSAPSPVVIYVSVPSIDPVLKKIRKAGGKTVTPRTIIPGMVTFAQFKDPAGNLMGLVEDAMPPAEKVEKGRKASKAPPSKKAKRRSQK